MLSFPPPHDSYCNSRNIAILVVRHCNRKRDGPLACACGHAYSLFSEDAS